MSDVPRLIGSSDAKPREFVLVKNETRIGSGADNDLVIDAATVSSRHAVMWENAGRFRLTDLNSTNGTFVNGRRVVGSATLRNGDDVKFGTARYKFAVIDERLGMVAGALPVGSGTVELAAARAVSGSAAQNGVRARLRRAPGRRRAFSIATAMAGAGLLFALGFIITEYMVNFGRMEMAGEQWSKRPAVFGGSSTAPGDSAVARDESRAPAPAVGASAAAWVVNSTSAKANETAPGWLAALNRYRQTAHLDPVPIDPALRSGAENHSRYMILNYLPTLKRDVNLGSAMHTEDPTKPYYTAEGQAAAAASDVDFMVGPSGFKPASPSWAIDSWMSGPFHRIWILNPWLHQVGYGEYCSEGVCSAVLNVLSDSVQPPLVAQRFAMPIEFPADKAVTALRQVEGEWPDPAASCPGYESPSGLPITLELGPGVDPRLSAYSIIMSGSESAEVEACAYTAATYVNSDPTAQGRARRLLETFGAVVVVPRAPLIPGGYDVAITAGGRQYKWSFTVR